MAQTRGWLTALKMHTAIVWVANRAAGIEVSGKQRNSEENNDFWSAVEIDAVGGPNWNINGLGWVG